jgi:hypothetical protein
MFSGQIGYNPCSILLVKLFFGSRVCPSMYCYLVQARMLLLLLLVRVLPDAAATASAASDTSAITSASTDAADATAPAATSYCEKRFSCCCY